MCGFPRKKRNRLICCEVELGKWKFLESQTHEFQGGFQGRVLSIRVFPFWFRFDSQNWAGERLLRRGPKWLSWRIEVHTAVRKYFSHYDACFMYVNLYGPLHPKSSNAQFSSFACAFLKWSNKALRFFPQGVSKEDRNKHPQLLQFGLLLPEINMKLEKKGSRLFKRKNHFPKFDDHLFAHVAHAKIEKIAITGNQAAVQLVPPPKMGVD